MESHPITENETTIKVMVIGDQAVGKSSIMLRYTENIFSVNMMGTAGIDVRKKIIKIQNQTIRLLIYDSAGHERFRQITQTQYKGAKGIILVYDLTDSKTFENVINWIKSITDNADHGVQVLMVGNKNDLTENRQVTAEEQEKLCSQFGFPFIETSALTGENIDGAFNLLVDNILKNEIKIKKSKEIELNTIKDNIVIKNKPKEKKKCCS